MPFWSSLYFPNANSPLMEQLLFFHDHIMIILILITVILSYMIINLCVSKFYVSGLIEAHSLEIIWTLIPALLLIFIALPSLRILYLMDENFEPSLTLKIIGHQWYWTYELSDFDIEFDSFMLPQETLLENQFRLLDTDNILMIPYNTNIRTLVSSSDVIHAWSMPSMGLKIDAIPGRLNQIILFASRPGWFFGQCSEICGANHSFMPISLCAVSINEFLKFVK